ncbi:MAG: hypothetical protein JST84_29875 [Acidobacteria bacterium]|jgi:hypothetical protein|nr:hypothetical protein [Acidobacteriota bacterium]
MSELIAGIIGLFILLMFGLFFIGGPIALVIFLLVRKRKPRAPSHQSTSDFGSALDRDDNFTHHLSGGAFSNSVESSNSSWESSGSDSFSSSWD